jgi:hypothetical protein
MISLYTDQFIGYGRVCNRSQGCKVPMCLKEPNCKRLQGAADAGRRERRRTFVLQVPDNKADAVPCKRLREY